MGRSGGSQKRLKNRSSAGLMTRRSNKNQEDVFKDLSSEEIVSKIIKNPELALPKKDKSFPDDQKNFQKVLSSLSKEGAHQLDSYLQENFGYGLTDIAKGNKRAHIAGVTEKNGKLYVSMLDGYRGEKRKYLTAQGRDKATDKEFIFEGGSFVIEDGKVTEQYYSLHHELKFGRREKVGEYRLILFDGKISKKVLAKAHDHMTSKHRYGS
jgi:hypothetical protein